VREALPLLRCAVSFVSHLAAFVFSDCSTFIDRGYVDWRVAGKV
jgi:hypothetical protein